MNTHISATPNKILMQNARDSLRGKWGIAISMIIITGIMGCVVYIPIIGWLIWLIITPAISLGALKLILTISRNEEPKLEQIFSVLQDGKQMGTAIGAYILNVIFVYLGFLFFLIPGIILAYALSLTFYILVDDSQIGAFDAIKKSYHLMKGNKWKALCLLCRFIGWILLACCTLGIGFLWLYPYMGVAYANFYTDIIKENDSLNIQQPESLENNLKVDNFISK